MAIELIDKIKQKNNGTFKLVDAIDVEMSNGSDAESTIKLINKQIQDHIENHPAGGVATANVHVGEFPPESEYLNAWIDTSDDEEFMQDVPDLVLDEFRNIFSTMQEQIASLKLKNTELEARIYYLEMYGGGNSGVTNGDILVLEDKTILTLEDGTVLTFE
jgi:DNA phosphorothioation-dependent restriction protein DptG